MIHELFCYGCLELLLPLFLTVSSPFGAVFDQLTTQRANCYTKPEFTCFCNIRHEVASNNWQHLLDGGHYACTVSGCDTICSTYLHNDSVAFGDGQLNFFSTNARLL